MATASRYRASALRMRAPGIRLKPAHRHPHRGPLPLPRPRYQTPRPGGKGHLPARVLPPWPLVRRHRLVRLHHKWQHQRRPPGLLPLTPPSRPPSPASASAPTTPATPTAPPGAINARVPQCQRDRQCPYPAFHNIIPSELN